MRSRKATMGIAALAIIAVIAAGLYLTRGSGAFCDSASVELHEITPPLATSINVVRDATARLTYDFDPSFLERLNVTIEVGWFTSSVAPPLYIAEATVTDPPQTGTLIGLREPGSVTPGALVDTVQIFMFTHLKEPPFTTVEMLQLEFIAGDAEPRTSCRSV